jgi:hypothetical protein
MLITVVQQLSFVFSLVPKPKGEAPTFTSELLPTKATEGEEVKLVCKVSGKPQPTVEWFKDDQPLKTDRQAKSSYDGRASTLVLSDVSLDDVGTYKCVVKNDFGSVTSSTDVSVDKKGIKPEAKEKLKNTEAFEEGKAQFDVKLSGYPTPEVEWFHGTKKLTDNEKYKTTQSDDQVYSLLIMNLKRDDAGSYKCVASNDAGKSMMRAELNVKEKQFIPEFVD